MRQHRLDALFEPPPVPLLELVLQAAEPLEGGQRGLLSDLRQRHVLHQRGDAKARLSPHRPGVGGLMAADDLAHRAIFNPRSMRIAAGEEDFTG